jgi:Tol biopolymer transport system component
VRVRVCTAIAAAVAALVLSGVATGASGTPKWIVFSAEAEGAGAAQLFKVKTDGTGLAQLTTGKQAATNPSFSPDGRRIVFVRLSVGIFRMNLDGSGLERLTSGPRDSFPVWSPDGSRIAFLRIHQSFWRVHVMPASGGKARLLRLAPTSGRPSWSADGKSLWLPTNGDVSKVDARTGRAQAHRSFRPELSSSQAATVSPDGTGLAFVARRPLSGPSDCGESPCAGFALYLSTTKRPRKFHIANDTGPAGWSPDGKTLVYVYKGALTLTPAGTRARTTIPTGGHAAAGDAPPAWQP